MSYTESNVTTNFSFLQGASHPEEMVEQAAIYGYKEIAITDHNSFAGIVRAHVAAKAKGIFELFQTVVNYYWSALVPES